MIAIIYYYPVMRSTLPPAIQEAMKAKKKSLADLAVEVGCSVPTTRKILRGEDPNSRSILRSVAKSRLMSILGIDIA
jgi:transcriptional regulator with XRE-family HTH domain